MIDVFGDKVEGGWCLNDLKEFGDEGVAHLFHERDFTRESGHCVGGGEGRPSDNLDCHGGTSDDMTTEPDLCKCSVSDDADQLVVADSRGDSGEHLGRGTEKIKLLLNRRMGISS